MPDVSFPSEKVPAPPSPNWTLELVFKIPLFIKLSTVFLRFSTCSPCSITIGLYPYLTKVKAANKPLGPAPTITGLTDLFRFSSNFGCSIFLIKEMSLFFKNFSSFFTQMSIEYE